MGSYNFVRYHAFVNCIYFRYLVHFIDFSLIVLPTILFAVWRETKQTRKYQGDYLVKKTTLPCPYFMERYCALFMYLQVDCMYMSASAVPAEVPEKAFFMHNDLWIRLENQHDWKLEKHTFLLLSVIVVLTSCVVVNLHILEVLSHLAVWIFNFDG